MSKKYILLLTIMWLAFQPFENVNAALRTKVRICAVKGTVQTGDAEGIHDGLESYTCPLKQTMNQTECRVVNQATVVETGPDGYATIEYADGRKARIMPNTTVVLSRNNIYVKKGSSWFKVEKGEHDQFVVKTPTAIAGIRGTEFIVNVDKDGSTNFQLIEGSVEISDAKKKSSMMLAAGMEVSIAKGSSTLNTALLKINENNKWWTDWPTLIPIAQMQGFKEEPTSSTNNGNTLFPIADNHVYAYSYSNWNKSNWGKYEQIGAGWNLTGGEKRAFLKFDISGIDLNNFEKATLKLYHNHTGGGNAVELGVYPIHGPWTEGRGTYKPASAALPGELTWNNQPKIAQYPTVYFNPGQGTNKWVEVDVTTLVKAWLEGFPNHGMVIKAGENYIGKSEAQYGFYSREYEDVDKRPQLVLNGTGGTTTSNNDGNITLPITDLQAQGTARLLTVNSNQDMVGPNETYRVNGKTDAIFRAQFRAPNRTVTAVEVSNTNGLRSVWDTRPNNGLWLGGVVNQDRTMSRSDGSVNFSLGSDQNTLDFFVEDNGSIRGGETNYRMTIFFASGEPLIMDIVPVNSSNTTVVGQWKINQHNGYDGTLILQQNQLGRITGTANWNQYDNGTIDGQVSGNSVEFTIKYASGDYGKYTGTLTQNGIKIVNGFHKAKNGKTASWDATKAINESNSKIYRWHNLQITDYADQRTSIATDAQMKSRGYGEKKYLFTGYIETKNKGDKVALYSYYHPQEKDWVTTNDELTSKVQMKSWGYKDRTFLCYVFRNKLSSDYREISRWRHPVEIDWVTTTQSIATDAQMRSWGYREKKILGYYRPIIR